MTAEYRLQPIEPQVADRLRAQGGVRYVADEKPGYPCRQCLCDAEIGESLLLVAHDPFGADKDSAYRSRSPIFIHEETCGEPAVFAELPHQLTHRQLSVRAFDRHAMMLNAAVIDGSELAVLLGRFFSDAATEEVHVHNAVRGCWATTVVRA